MRVWRRTSSSTATWSWLRWSTSSGAGRPDGVDGEILRRALGAEAAVLRSDRVRIELQEDPVGDEDLAGLGGVAEAGGDVDVDAEVVAACLVARAELDAGAQLRAEARDLDRGDPLPGGEGGLGRALRIPERCHQAVP